MKIFISSKFEETYSERNIIFLISSLVHPYQLVVLASFLIQPRSNPVPTEANLEPIGISYSKLFYFLLEFSCVVSVKLWKESKWDDENSTNGDGDTTFNKTKE